ncbi:D-alanyl-D-alanine carboxypeptidase family protein [Bacillus sp. T33-2]|uniref:D-alanyl-D-alanine carboxypeptidase family protein n=1 Tax=Bacillus sp. T33-2 TaxID=2054168 RepID=UPI000C75B0E2|nr:D-alanyl-D-alanine carboxypeptidase family protein [Bacillus sp. T33-2]PLR98788.1 D-alanyl-D-alanine carboxypeptidase [Bacillus sp. T33-2]
MRKIIILTLFIMLGLQVSTPARAQQPNSPDITSEAAALVDSQSGAMLFGKNENLRMYPASLTKIATAIYAIENGDLNEIVTVSENAVNVEGTRVYLNAGEQVPLRNLVQGMLINSGNDAAVAIAEHLDGSVENFSKQINVYLRKKIGIKNTNFKNPHGLYNENHYTTATDLALVLNHAMGNSDFKEIFGTKELAWKGESWETTVHSHHRLLKGEIPYQGITGGKTGFVDQSKQTLATTAENGNIKLTAVALKSELKRDIYADTIKMLDFGFMNYRSTPLKKGAIFKNEKASYEISREIYITEPLQDGEKSVNEAGMLLVRSGNGEIIQSVKLEQIKQNSAASKDKGQAETDKNDMLSFNSFLSIILLGMTAIVWKLNTNLRRRKSRW